MIGRNLAAVSRIHHSQNVVKSDINPMQIVDKLERDYNNNTGLPILSLRHDNATCDNNTNVNKNDVDNGEDDDLRSFLRSLFLHEESKNLQDNDNSDRETVEISVETDRDILNRIECLKKALRKSMVSQQKIQEWDRKMGLRRCHSKTMSRTTVSRMQLKAFLEIASPAIIG